MQLKVQLLIPLVEARPVIWDRTHASHREKKVTQEAWYEICSELDCNFRSYEDEERYLISKAVIRKWNNIRDSFFRSLKREKQLKESDSNVFTETKEYVYAKYLKFLTNMHIGRPTDNSASTRASSDSEIETTTLDGDDDCEGQRNIKTECDTLPPRIELVTRKRKINDVEAQPGSLKKLISTNDVDMQLTKPSENSKDRHISFFKGIAPSLHTFTEDQIIQFQMGVLQLITNMKQNRIQS